MKPIKFLIVTGDSESLVEDVSLDLGDQMLYMSDEPHICVIECRSSSFEDNCWTFYSDEDEVTFVKDINGMLYYFTDVRTREQLIEQMEESADSVDRSPRR